MSQGDLEREVAALLEAVRQGLESGQDTRLREYLTHALEDVRRVCKEGRND